jgi:hypothetical protein
MNKIENSIPDGSGKEDRSYLLGTFFRDRGEELLLEDESDDRSETDLHHGTHLRNDVDIVEMLFNAEVAVLFRPDRIEIRSKKLTPEISEVSSS